LNSSAMITVNTMPNTAWNAAALVTSNWSVRTSSSRTLSARLQTAATITTAITPGRIGTITCSNL
jgi:hypothetical protein